MLIDNLVLVGDHLIVNVMQSENYSSGIINLNPDPTEKKRKPSVYVGVVEKIGPRVSSCKVGDKISFERYERRQFKVSSGTLIIRQREVLMVDPNIPMPGVVAVRLIDKKDKSGLLQEADYEDRSAHSFKGIVIASNDPDAEKGDIIYFEKSSDEQYTMEGNILIFRTRSAQILQKVENVEQKTEEKSYQLGVL